MSKDQEKEEIKCDRDILFTREQYRRMRASTEAFREHSFERYDPFLRKKSAIHDVTRIPGYTYIRLWRQKRETDDEKKQKETTNASKNLFMKWKSVSKKTEPKKSEETNLKSKWAVAKNVIQEKEPVAKSKENATTKEVFENFLRNATGHTVSAPVRRIRRREKTFSYARDRTIFPGSCKSSYESRKFMEQEVSNIMFSLSPEGRRKANIDKLKAEAQLPDFIKRTRTLSAILKNYKDYKDNMTCENVKSETFLTA
jgi:hypothetical protein